MASGLFGKIIKGLMIGAGTILSLIPHTIAIGAPLLVAGAAINTQSSGTQDLLSAYASSMVSQIPALQAGQETARRNYMINNILEWLQNNLILIVVGAAAFFLIFRRKRTRR